MVSSLSNRIVYPIQRNLLVLDLVLLWPLCLD